MINASCIMLHPSLGKFTSRDIKINLMIIALKHKLHKRQEGLSSFRVNCPGSPLKTFPGLRKHVHTL